MQTGQGGEDLRRVEGADTEQGLTGQGGVGGLPDAGSGEQQGWHLGDIWLREDREGDHIFCLLFNVCFLPVTS